MPPASPIYDEVVTTLRLTPKVSRPQKRLEKLSGLPALLADIA